MDGNGPRGEDDNLSIVGSGRVDVLFDDVEGTIESLAGLSDELESVRRRIEANEGRASGAVRDRVNDDADQLADEAESAVEKLRDALRSLKRTV